ncbi:MAG: fimbrial chaperone [Aeromonas sp.]
MKKLAKKIVVASLIMGIHTSAMAAFTLSSTRFIYDGGKKNISFKVTNNAEQTYGGQVWINNTTQNKDDVFIVPAPPFFKVKPKQKQVVRLLQVNNTLPQDRESLFWLNVQEIPPKAAATDSSVLAIAMNTKVKLIYRPEGLRAGRKDAEAKVQVVRQDGGTALKNPTPYYFAVIKVKQNGKPINITTSQNAALSIFAPYSEISLGRTVLSGGISIDAINDNGGTMQYNIK